MPSQTPPHCHNPSGSTGLDCTFADTCTASVAVSANQIVPVDLHLNASASSGDTSATAFLNASDTAKITAVLLTDAQVNVLTGIPLYDASGYNYNQAPASPLAATPEPASLLLLTTGALCLYMLTLRLPGAASARGDLRRLATSIVSAVVVLTPHESPTRAAAGTSPRSRQP